jgi:hypothetical protein
MEDVCHGLATAQVICLDGEWEQVAHLVHAQPHELFSPLRMDLSRVVAVLTAKRWDGVVPLVVFLGCETWARQPKQAVLWIATDHSVMHTMGIPVTTRRRTAPSETQEKACKRRIDGDFLCANYYIPRSGWRPVHIRRRNNSIFM